MTSFISRCHKNWDRLVDLEMKLARGCYLKEASTWQHVSIANKWKSNHHIVWPKIEDALISSVEYVGQAAPKRRVN